jgi:excisionase family DNA binding protein
MSEDYVSLEEAARRSGLHLNTLRRLLREGVIRGYKARHEGRYGWWVSAMSLRQYTDPFHGFLLELTGPKLFLRRQGERRDDDEAGIDSA